MHHGVRQSVRKQDHYIIPPSNKRGIHDRNVNTFDLLYNEPECYICHNYGHKASECNLKNHITYSKVTCLVETAKVWRKKKDN